MGMRERAAMTEARAALDESVEEWHRAVAEIRAGRFDLAGVALERGREAQERARKALEPYAWTPAPDRREADPGMPGRNPAEVN